MIPQPVVAGWKLDQHLTSMPAGGDWGTIASYDADRTATGQIFAPMMGGATLIASVEAGMWVAAGAHLVEIAE